MKSVIEHFLLFCKDRCGSNKIIYCKIKLLFKVQSIVPNTAKVQLLTLIKVKLHTFAIFKVRRHLSDFYIILDIVLAIVLFSHNRNISATCYNKDFNVIRFDWRKIRILPKCFILWVCNAHIGSKIDKTKKIFNHFMYEWTILIYEFVINYCNII